MSIDSVKTALFIGPLTATTQQLKEAFAREGLDSTEISYSDATPNFLIENKPGIIIINTLQDKQISKLVLNAIKNADLSKKLSVMALIQQTEEEMKGALALGAADFFTDTEDVESIMIKAKNLMGESNNFAGSTIVDISEAAPALKNKKGVRVYVVEDDVLLKNLLSLKLEQSKFPADFSMDGDDIVTKLEKFKPQVIVLDIMLPGKNGLDILAEIKQQETLKEIPVIIFSNRDEQADRNRAKELGAASFYVKALTDLSDLIRAIDALA